MKEVEFRFDDSSLKAFNTLKERLITAPLISVNYTTIEKELLAVVHAFDKFCSYLIGAQLTVYTDHAALKHLLSKQEAKPRLIRLPIESIEDEKILINEEFPDEKLLSIPVAPWYVDMENFKATNIISAEMSWQQRKKLFHDSKFYLWDEPFLYKQGVDGLRRRCILREEKRDILWHCHSSAYGGHLNGKRTTSKVIDFMGSFPSSCSNEYILLVVDYVSKWVELVFGKACHLLFELEHKAYWATRFLNFNAKVAGEGRLLQLHVLEEFRLNAYENEKIYKAKTKKWHDKPIKHRVFKPGQLVLLFNSRLKLFPGKLKSRWSGPLMIKEVSAHGTVTLESMQSQRNFKVNRQCVKPYFGEPPENSSLMVGAVSADSANYPDLLAQRKMALGVQQNQTIMIKGEESGIGTRDMRFIPANNALSKDAKGNQLPFTFAFSNTPPRFTLLVFHSRAVFHSLNCKNIQGIQVLHPSVHEVLID
ncbi:hypothetical protein VNO77_14935 [Canavalia gladiata]|uniref:Reverse transcriptase RNase H-like domain-containing protein n=1 Tax=Canavalia gladiata TaxID=3824 RepID=A0AAN9M3D2_CANGL